MKTPQLPPLAGMTPLGLPETTRVMDYETAEHFYLWIDGVHIEDQHTVEQDIHAFLREYPEVVSEGRSWPEIRTLAERMANV